MSVVYLKGMALHKKAVLHINSKGIAKIAMTARIAKIAQDASMS